MRPGDDAAGDLACRGGPDLSIQVGWGGYSLGLPDELFQVSSQGFRITPASGDQNPAFRGNDKFRVGPIAKRMLEIVRHGICKPWDFRIELPAGRSDMFEPLLDRYGLDESVAFRMGEGFVNIVEIQFLTLLPVVMMDSLQTGDITKEGGSCQTAEDNHRMPALEFFS